MKATDGKLGLLLGLTLALLAASASEQGNGLERSANGLAYERVGDGPAVVLIHGANLDHRLWNREVGWLREGRTVIRYDIRGHGRSELPTSSYAGFIDLFQLLDELEVGEAALIGLSDGARIALDAAIMRPERVRSLVLVSPSVGGFRPSETPPFFQELIAALRDQDFAAANEALLASPIMRVPEDERALVRRMVEGNERLWTVSRQLERTLEPPAIERLDQVRAPTLVLVGSDDLDLVHEQADLLVARVPDARKVVIPGGGHLLNLTSPRAFRREVSEFLGLGTGS